MNKFLLSGMLIGAFVMGGMTCAPADLQAAEAARMQLNRATADELATSGAVDKATAEKIVKLREDLGGFQSYDDLEELGIPAEQMQKLRDATTIQSADADCNC